MKKQQTKPAAKKFNRKNFSKKSLAFFAIGAFIIVLLVGLFISKIGKAIYYGHVTRSAYHTEYKNLKPALEGLGLSENEAAKSDCKVKDVATDGINTSKVLLCGLQTEGYTVVNASNKQTVLAAAKLLDDLSDRYGGRMYTNTGPTFSKYFTDIANGVDYNPDFGVTFIRSNYLCEVHVNVAFSKPKSPAYSIQFGCNSPIVTKDNVYLQP